MHINAAYYILSISPVVMAFSVNGDSDFFFGHFVVQEEVKSLLGGTDGKEDSLIRVLKELTAVQRKTADLQVELQGRKVIVILICLHITCQFWFYGRRETGEENSAPKVDSAFVIDVA